MTSWSLGVELDHKGVGASDVDDLMESLKGDHPAIGEAPNGNLSVRVFADAETAQEALRTGVSAVVEAARMNGFSTRVLGVELITESELDRRLDE